MCLKQRDFVKWDAGFANTLCIHTPVHLICSPQVYLEYSRQSLIFIFNLLKMHVVCQSKSDYFSEYKALLSSEKCCDLHRVFGLLQKNNLCDQQKFMILPCFVHHDKLNN